MARRPDEDELIDRLGDRQLLWNEQHARACRCLQEVREVPGHRSEIVGDQDSPCFGCHGQDLEVREAYELRLQGARKIDRRFLADRRQEDRELEVGIRLVADSTTGAVGR